jgi:hypothetical protein
MTSFAAKLEQTRFREQNTAAHKAQDFKKNHFVLFVPFCGPLLLRHF